MICEVLGDVARVLDAPVGVVAEARVAGRLELVLVVVAGVEEVARSSPGCRRAAAPTGMAAPMPAETDRRTHVPPPPTSMKNGAPKTTGQAGGAGEPEQQPGEQLPPVEQVERPPQRRDERSAAAARGDGAVSTSSSASGSAPSATPTASSRNVTATTWAKNQVVPSWAAYQNTVPKPKKTVVASRTRRETGSRPSAHQASPTSIAPSSDRDRPDVGGQAPDRHERQEQIAGRGGNGSSAPSPTVAGQLAQRVDVLHPVVAAREAAARPGQSIAARRRRNAIACHTKWL